MEWLLTAREIIKFQIGKTLWVTNNAVKVSITCFGVLSFFVLKLDCTLTPPLLIADYKRVGIDSTLKTDGDKENARTELFGRIRFYVCPYAIHRQSELGNGFLFIQSECTLAEISLFKPTNVMGHSMGMRSVLIHFLTMGEFDSEVCRDDFELAEVRMALQKAIQEIDVRKQVVLLTRFRCGHLAVGLAALVPDYGICKSLGKSYYANSKAGALQLNIDDI